MTAFVRAVELLDAGDLEGLRKALAAQPDLVREKSPPREGNYFIEPTLLEFVAGNPTRHGRVPDNAVEIARLIIDAGAERDSLTATVELVASGSLARQQGLQIPLIELLCSRGGDPNPAMPAALGHGEFDAARALVRWGAAPSLAYHSALGNTVEALGALQEANAEERHRALALAAQFGRTEIVRALLAAGEDPNRFNPPMAHQHSTPLHQAALAGHRETVQALLEAGARRDIQDRLFHATPAGWAHHGGHVELAGLIEA